MESEFNKLPEGFEGEQKRRTDFKSPNEKLAYDVKNLIQLAKDRYNKKQVTVRDVLDLATRNDDNVEDLRKAIAIEIKAKPEFGQFIDGLDLDDADKRKLKEMMSAENYQKAIATAQEMDSNCKPPAYAQIATELMTYSEERLRDICEMMEVPTLLIVPDNGFNEKITAMNAHKHYTSKNGKPQEDAYVNGESDSPYKNVPKMSSGIVSIVDGVVHPKQLTEVSIKLGERRSHLTKKFAAKDMHHISKDEMAALMQQSLKEAEETKDNNKIVDNWETGDGTITFIDPDSLTESTLVAYAYFHSDYRRVYFYADGPGVGRDYTRGRPSVQVLKF
ncbi:hypothetical protein HZA39_01360 [Candidatus Peregrinibacteria bacterium]|nr:hypothetical protein [Candidatus Peregrinibacteria bacterium]